MSSLRSALLGGVGVACLVLLAAACGGAGGGGEYADKCALVCKPPAGPCATQDQTSCQTSCNTALEGLSVACAQCVVEHSGWSGSVCTCSGSDCSEDGFGPGDNFGGGGPDICDPARDTHCSGFDLAETSGGDCKSICAAGG